MKIFKRSFLWLLLIFFVVACKTIDLNSITRYQQANNKPDQTIGKDSVSFTFDNPLTCPIQIVLNSDDKILNQKFDTLILASKKDTSFSIQNLNEKVKISYSVNLGDKRKKINNEKLQLPFSKGKKVRIVQGNNSNYTHNKIGNKYAIDFALNKKDTIKSADNGYVVGVIQDYNISGVGEQYDPFANFVTVYNPKSGLFIDYVHLKYKGSLVKVGDKITKGQTLGFVGMTGNTDVLHLHFNALVPNKKGILVSYPIEFDAYKGESLVRDQIVEH